MVTRYNPEIGIQSFPAKFVMGIDTEFYRTHTLAVQAAARLGPETLAVQIYRSSAIPDLPWDFDSDSYFSIASTVYGRFFQHLVLRPVRLLTPDLSPARIMRDLLRLEGVEIHSRQEGWMTDGQFDPFSNREPSNGRLDPKTSRLKVPEILLTLVGHFLPADFTRIHSRAFYDNLRPEWYQTQAEVGMRHRKLLSWVVRSGRRVVTDPVLEYLHCGEELFGVRGRSRDTMLPFGRGSLDGLSKTFLGVGKVSSLTDEDKQNMLQTFQTKTSDAYGYAMRDAVNTLLVHEEMVRRDQEIYHSFGFSRKETPPLRPSLGSRVATFLVETTRRVAASSNELPSRRGLYALMRKGGLGLFADHSGVSKFGTQTGKVHGGLLYSRSSTKFWHEARGMMRDVDMAGCYNRIIGRQNVYFGRPIIFEPGASPLNLASAVALVSEHAPQDGWIIRVTGDITAAPNVLIPSTEGAITSTNFRQSLRAGKRRAARRAFHLEALRDPGSVRGTQGGRLYSRRVESGVVTWATWLMIQALPEDLRKEYESLRADSVIFYPRILIAADGKEFDDLVEKYRDGSLPWEAKIDLGALEITEKTRIDADYVTLKYPIGEFATEIGRFRKDAQKKEGKGSGLDKAFKEQANTMYGVLVSPHLPTGNFVAGNQITAQARAEAFALSQALNAIQTITDGSSYRIDQIPAITYAECIKVKPDYPIRRAEEGDGIPFKDPSTIPQCDIGYTDWYHEHVKWFFGVCGAKYDSLFKTHDLEHKLTGETKSVAFDALACDGSGNYAKCISDSQDWSVAEFKARSYGRQSKEMLKGWVVETYCKDRLTELAPVTEDTELLSFAKAGQKARKALDAGVPEVYFPLGLEFRKVLAYKVFKEKAFVFQTPEQRAAILKQWQKFEDRTGAGLEVLCLRRGYRNRQKGSLVDLAEAIYEHINGGGMKLDRALNLIRIQPLGDIINARKALLASVKEDAEQDLLSRIDVRNLDPATLVTGYVVTAADLITEHQVTLRPEPAGEAIGASQTWL